MTPSALRDLLFANKYEFITGVPDSIFKHFLLEINEDTRFQHVLTNNEGEACALAAGYYLASGKTPIIYMQNSGLGNCINPLTSLLDSHLYSIPALLLIAWRGLPGEKDEPQHRRMGEVLPGMCSLLDIPYGIADRDSQRMDFIFKHAETVLTEQKKPFAMLFPRSVMTTPQVTQEKSLPENVVLREHLLEWIVRNTTENDVLVTTTGKTSRELYEIRERLGHDHSRDFLTVGSMGCSATIALGIAMQRTDRRVILVDGDGACLMRMEALATIGHIKPKNLLHVLVDNNSYESTGAQKTLSGNVDFAKVAKACNYRNSVNLDSLKQFAEAFNQITEGPSMLVIKSYPFSRPDLGRPKTTPIENKMKFMQQLGVLA